MTALLLIAAVIVIAWIVFEYKSKHGTIYKLKVKEMRK